MISNVPRFTALLLRLGAVTGLFAWLARRLFGQQIAAMMGLTWKAAFRFRLFIVILALLLGSVILLPILIKDDGTAEGFTQILITYTLSTVTGLLGLSTLWLSCGTLARDIEECQLQVLAVKPIARWQIWLGKWLGIMSLNAALLLISGTSIYALLQVRASKLPPNLQATLRNEVLVARGSAKPEENVGKEIEAETERVLRERRAATDLTTADLKEVRKQIREQIKAEYQVVPPGYQKIWNIDLGLAKSYLRDKPLQLRIKFNAADNSTSGTFDGIFFVGVPQKTALWRTDVLSLAPDTFHEIRIPPNLYDENGILTVTFANPPSNMALLFPLGEGMEVLYPQGNFGLNFARGVGIIFCWMGLLAAIGLASASFLSFPVAAFFALGLLTIVFASGTISTAIEDGTIMGFNSETGKTGHSVADTVVIPIFKAILKIVKLAKDFSPIDSLSTGRSISWAQLGIAFAQIVLLLGGIAAIGGMAILTRRELATAQGTH
jgi:hypothetical protein